MEPSNRQPASQRPITRRPPTTTTSTADVLGLIGSLIGTGWGLIRTLAIIVVAIFLLVAWFNSCASNATLNEHSSCQQFNQADTSTQDKVLQAMMTAHHDNSSISFARANVTLYCDTHDSSAPIDGVYGSGNIGQPPAQSLRISILLRASAHPNWV